MQNTVPIYYSYKVNPFLYGGEYPFSADINEGKEKLRAITDFGCRVFIDLTSPVEKLTRYHPYLQDDVAYHYFPTKDVTAPASNRLFEIHNIIANAERELNPVYVHCRGGYDRTGAVIASYFVFNGVAPQEALKQYKKYFYDNPKRNVLCYRYSLIENSPALLSVYKKWLTATP